MYKEFFGLDDTPFTLTPDPRFIVFTPSYNEVLASLYYGLENAKGLIVLTGEVGRVRRRLCAGYCGVSTPAYWRHMSSIRGCRSRILSARHADARHQGLVEQVRAAQIHGQGARGTSSPRPANGDHHRRGTRTFDYVLEEIRLLLNFESDKAKHLQIVLTGQPELRDKLNQPNLRQFKQRVALRCNMHAFPNVEEVDRYITERLMIAGSRTPNVFTPVRSIYLPVFGGIPRNINNICDNAMLAAYRPANNHRP